MDIVERLRETAHQIQSPPTMELRQAADEIERLREALSDLLDEAEDVFVCMADATGIDRHNYPEPYLKARSALKETE